MKSRSVTRTQIFFGEGVGAQQHQQKRQRSPQTFALHMAYRPCAQDRTKKSAQCRGQRRIPLDGHMAPITQRRGSRAGDTGELVGCQQMNRVGLGKNGK